MSAVSFTLAAVIFLLALYVFFVSLDAKSKNKPVEFFGRSFVIVLTDSMTPEIGVGELVVIESTGIESVQVGQNAVFVSLSGMLKGQRIIHKVVEVGHDEQGVYLRTQGVKEGAPVDPDPVRAENFTGVEVGHSVFWGKIIGFFTKLENWLLLLVVLVAVSIAIMQIVKIVKIAKNPEDSDKQNGS